VIDEEADLRERFAQLRNEEQRGAPPFRPVRARRTGRLSWRWIAAAATLIVAVFAIFTLRSRPTAFTDSDRAAVRSVGEWHPPTDFLLHPPGIDLLATTPRIPDLKGIPQ
jgi:hypothetical protein